MHSRGADHTEVCMRMFIRSAVALLASTLCCASLLAQETSSAIALGERLSVHSSVLNQDRRYLVYLPPSYNDPAAASKAFPVIYLLDGGAHFNAATGVLHHLSSPNSGVGRIPEMIVVAVPNMGRTHNMTPTHVTSGLYSENSGGAAEFLRFLHDELFPEIQSRYRVSAERTIIGHSLAGLFALHVFLERPETFDHYIAIDPSLWWDGQLLVKRLAKQPVRIRDRPISLFIALANSPASEYADIALKKQHEGGIRGFHNLLRRRSDDTLHVGFEFFAQETHISVPLIAIYKGLLFSFPKS
jgi:uncharacterized protein